MNDKQKRFVQEYLVDMNATQAYIRAGYSANGADVSASRLLGNASVREAIEKGLAKQAERLRISAERNLEELSCLAYYDPSDVFDFTGDHIRLKPANQISERGRRAMSSFKFRQDGTLEQIKFTDKTPNLTTAMKVCKQLTDKLEVTGKDGTDLRLILDRMRSISIEEHIRVVDGEGESPKAD